MSLKFISCDKCGGSGKIPDMRHLGEEMRKRRKSLNLSIQEVSRRMGYSVAYLLDVERGNRRYTVRLERKFLEATKLV